MKLSEKIIESIQADGNFTTMQKTQASSFIRSADAALQKEFEDMRLIQEIANEKNIDQIILSTDEVKIYALKPGKSVDDWETKYPYRSIFKMANGQWVRNSTVSPNMELAFLIYLGNKYDGANTQFADFATKMLGIKIPE